MIYSANGVVLGYLLDHKYYNIANNMLLCVYHKSKSRSNANTTIHI